MRVPAIRGVTSALRWLILGLNNASTFPDDVTLRCVLTGGRTNGGVFDFYLFKGLLSVAVKFICYNF